MQCDICTRLEHECMALQGLTSGRLAARRYIQNNKLTSLAGLARVPALTTLDAAGNALVSLNGVQHCPSLSTLQAGSNSFSGPEAVAAVRACTALMTLDLQDNQIADAAGLLQFLEVPCTPKMVPNSLIRSGHSLGAHESQICTEPCYTSRAACCSTVLCMPPRKQQWRRILGGARCG